MKIEVLGSGCPSCKKLEENVAQALTEKGIEAELTKVTDMSKILDYGVMSTPGLVVDGVVKSTGKILSPDEVAVLL